MFYFLRPLQKTSQPFLSNISLSLAQHVSALALFTCDIEGIDIGRDGYKNSLRS